MHAVIKIVSFLIFGAMVSMGNTQILLTGVLLVFPLYLFEGNVHLHNAIIMLKRLKWLFVSILIVYLFFTPGQLLLTNLYWGPTVEGLAQGGLRVGVLVLLVAAVNLLISSTQQDDFLSAVLWCLRPLSLFGLPHERLAVRITLTLDVVSQIRNDNLYKSRHESTEHGIASEKSNSGEPGLSEIKLIEISKTAHRLFKSVITAAEATAVREIPLPKESRPPLFQWLIPIALAALFTLVKYVGFLNP